jgi:hypothetical protein
VEPRHVEFVPELEPQLPSVLIEAIFVDFTMWDVGLGYLAQWKLKTKKKFGVRKWMVFHYLHNRDRKEAN